MSMIEKFLEAKEALRKDLAEIRDEALKFATEKVDKRIDEFVEGFELAMADVSDEEFVEFITSGKLDDEDINAAVMFRAKAKSGKPKVCSEPCGDPNVEAEEKHERPVHVIVIGEI